MSFCMTLKKDDVLDTIILYLLFSQVMFLSWMGLQSIVNYIVAILIAISFFIYYRQDFSLGVFWGLLLLIAYTVLNYLILGGSLEYLARNFWRYFKGLIILLYFCNLIYNKKEFIITFFNRHIGLLNFFMIINIPFLIIQLSGNHALSSLVYSTATANSRFGFDYISGLFGLYGTPCLALYSIFLFFFNYYFIQNIRKRRSERIIFSIYNYLILIFNIWVSTQNDNKGFFIIFPLFMILIYIINKLTNENNDKSQVIQLFAIIGRALLVVAFICLFIFIGYITINPFHDTVDSIFVAIINGFNYNAVSGSGERIGMILFLLSQPSRWATGYGLGEYLISESALGFMHFGQADFGPLICLGGCIQIVILFLTVYLSLQKVFDKRILSIITLLFYIVLSVYTQIFANTSCTICSMFLLLIVVMRSSKGNDIRRNEKQLNT